VLYVVNVDWFFLSHRLPLALAAKERGFEVHVATAVTDRAEVLKAHGLVVHELPLERSSLGVFGVGKTLIAMLRVFRTVRPDVAHLVTIKPVLLGGIVARLVRTPAVVYAVSGLGYVFGDNGIWARLAKVIVRRLYRIAFSLPNFMTIFQNENDQRALVVLSGLDEKNSVVIRGSGILVSACPDIPEPDGTPVVAMACRLLRDKGVFEFASAARLLSRKGVVARYWLIGDRDPDNLASLSSPEVDALREEGIVELLGFRSDVPSLYSRAHIVVLPSYREGLPKALVEAAACARPVVTTDVPGCRDAIEPGLTGLLVPPRDATALADALETLLRDKGMRERFGAAGRRLAESEFDIAKIVDAHFRIYDKLLGNAGIRAQPCG
jgi:glycosyltransferase involved in cell wall biosynthesis